MRKILLFLILFLLPFMVFAKDTCDSNNIKIQSIVLENSTGNIEELSDPSVNNQKINLGLKMNVLGDSAEYKIVLKNNSSDDYYFDEEAFNLDLDSVNYEIVFDDNTNLIKGGEEKVIYLKVSYKEQVDASNLNNGIYDGNQVMKLNVMTLENPFTGKFLGLLIFISLIIGFFVFYKDKMKTAYLLLLIALLIPFSVRAVCKHSLEINTRLVIDGKNAVFLPGKEVNIKMKTLSGDDTTALQNQFTFQNEVVTSIQFSEIEPINSNREDKNVVSTLESEYPIYMWYDNGTIYWWSEDRTPALNEDASYMFCKFNELVDISGLASIDSSNTQLLDAIFWYDNINSLLPLKNWNVSNSTSLVGAFSRFSTTMDNLDGLDRWDVSKVKNMNTIFSNLLLTDLNALKHWNLSSVLNLGYAFSLNNNLRNLEGLNNWNLSHVVYLAGIFSNDKMLEDLSAIKDWDTSSVVYMNSMFSYNNSITSLEPLRNWDTSNVQDFGGMFNHSISLTNLDGLENWNMSSAISLGSMFHNCSNLMDASSLANWDVSNVENVGWMFNISNDVETPHKYSMLPYLDIKNWNMKNVKEYSYFLESLRYVEAEFTVNSPNVEGYQSALKDASNMGGKIIVNYTAETESIVDAMIRTKTSGANVVKGVMVES